MHRRFFEANIVVVPCKRAQHCCATLPRSQNNRNVGTCCAKSLTVFKLYPSNANIFVVPRKRTQHIGHNNVACCWPTILRPFALALTAFTFYKKNILIGRIGRHLRDAKDNYANDDDFCNVVFKK